MNLREELQGSSGVVWEGLTEGRHLSKDPRGEGAGYVGKLWTEGTARAEAPRQRGRARRPVCMDLSDQGSGAIERPRGWSSAEGLVRCLEALAPLSASVQIHLQPALSPPSSPLPPLSIPGRGIRKFGGPFHGEDWLVVNSLAPDP